MTEATTDITIQQLPVNQPNPPKFDTRVDPASLQELFARDPEKLSDADIDTIVIELRKQRGLFEQQEIAKSMKEPKPKKTKPKQEGGEQFSLADLGL